MTAQMIDTYDFLSPATKGAIRTAFERGSRRPPAPIPDLFDIVGLAPEPAIRGWAVTEPAPVAPRMSDPYDFWAPGAQDLAWPAISLEYRPSFAARAIGAGVRLVVAVELIVTTAVVSALVGGAIAHGDTVAALVRQAMA